MGTREDPWGPAPPTRLVFPLTGCFLWSWTSAKNAEKRRFSRGETSWKKRPWKPVGTREDPWGPAPHTRLDFPIYRLFVCSLGPMRNGRPRQCPMAAPNALCLLWRTSPPFCSIILFPQLGTRAGDQPPQNFPQAETCIKPENATGGSWIPKSRLPTSRCWLWEVGIHLPQGGC